MGITDAWVLKKKERKVIIYYYNVCATSTHSYYTPIAFDKRVKY